MVRDRILNSNKLNENPNSKFARMINTRNMSGHSLTSNPNITSDKFIIILGDDFGVEVSLRNKLKPVVKVTYLTS